jgi:4-amino-4-deoxy-L-arabinose transferase-like glycosyltransferase
MATHARVAPSVLSWQRLLLLLYWPWELIPLLGTFAWLYRQTMPPGMCSWIIEGWDSAVLQVTGSTWGIPHSPGYPLYTILSNIFVRLVGLIPGLVDTSVAWRVSLWSSMTSLLTLVFLYFIVWKLTRDRVAALIAGAILGISFVFWRGAIMAEVYSLNTFIFAFTFWLALTWADDPRDDLLVALGLAVGAGMVHHRTALILPPTIALWVLLKTLSETERGRGWILSLILIPWPSCGARLLK